MTSEEEYDNNYPIDFWDEQFTGLNFVEKTIADIIYIYVSPFLLLFGTLGNVFSMLVMIRLSRHVFSTCIYLAHLAVVDLLVLYTRCGNDWLSNVAHIDLSNMLMVSSESICKVYPFVFNFIFHLSKWLLVSMAIEGFIATKYPEKVLTMCTLSRAKAVVLLLTVLLVCVNIHYFWSYELVDIKEMAHPNGLFCTFVKHGHTYSEEFQSVIWPILDLLVAEVIPYCTVIVCGATMIIQMAKGKHKGDPLHQQWRKRYQMHPDAMDQLKLTILLICFFYLLLTLPKFCFLIFRYLVETHELIEYSFQFEAQQMLAHAICASLEYCFLSFKFLLYFITSRQFRREYCTLFRRCFCRCRQKKVYSPSDSNLTHKPLMSSEVPTSVDRKSVNDDNWEPCDTMGSVYHCSYETGTISSNITTV